MSSSPARPLRLKMLWQHPAYAIALGFGSGLSPVAPGTAGTLFAWLSYTLLLSHLNPGTVGWILLASLLIGWWACKTTAQALQQNDPGAIVWDEIVAFWAVLWVLWPAGFAMQCLAFALFRFFDAAKPQPVRWADRCFKGSGWRGAWGIIWDDLVAAFCSLLVIAVLVRIF